MEKSSLQKVSAILIIVSNIFLTFIVLNPLMFNLVGESISYIIGQLIATVLIITIGWLAYYKSESNKGWMITGLVFNIIFLSILAVIGYILRLVEYSKQNN